MLFLMSVTVAAAAINSEVKNGSHAAKKVKKAVDPDISAGKTELTPLQANKYNLGDYAGSSTTIDTPDGSSNTVNMGVNAGIQFDHGPYPGNKILEGEHAGTYLTLGIHQESHLTTLLNMALEGDKSYTQSNKPTTYNAKLATTSNRTVKNSGKL